MSMNKHKGKKAKRVVIKSADSCGDEDGELFTFDFRGKPIFLLPQLTCNWTFSSSENGNERLYEIHAKRMDGFERITYARLEH